MSETLIKNEENYYPSYPGYVLQVGSSGSNVYLMQSYLNAIKEQLYHTMNRLVIDGKFGRATEQTVMQYQTIKNIKIDGKIGPVTWNMIVTDYNQLPIPHTDEYPGFVLRPGMSGAYVDNMQSKLNHVNSIYPGVCNQVQDAKYGEHMSCSVRMFQKHFGIKIDGLIGEKTWNKIVELDYDVSHNIYPNIHTKFGGNILSTGSDGDDVRMVQGMLDGILRNNSAANWSMLKVDGKFGRGTKQAVSEFQALYGLKIDGKVGRNTWDRLISEFNSSLH